MWNLGLTVALGATLVASGYSGGSYNPSGSGTIPNMGRCNPRIRSDSSINYDQFAREYNGFWVFRKVPITSFTTTLDWMHLHIDQQPYPSMWNNSIHYQQNNGNKEVLASEIVYDHGGGFVTIYDTNGNYYEARFLYYVPGKLAYYYICSNNGGDFEADYRYLLTHHGYEPTEYEYEHIRKIDWSLQFRNQLIDLPSFGPRDGKHSSNYNYCGSSKTPVVW